MSGSDLSPRAHQNQLVSRFRALLSRVLYLALHWLVMAAVGLGVDAFSQLVGLHEGPWDWRVAEPIAVVVTATLLTCGQWWLAGRV